LAVLAVLVVRGIFGVYAKYQKSAELLSVAQTNLASLEAREESLDRSIASLSTDEGRERELRDRFAVVKEGERLVVLVDKKDEPRPAPSAPASQGFWHRFLGWFGLSN
jgi:cell division protein FtsB